VATDADLAGQVAAQRDYWLLAQHGLSPQTVALRPGSDPAELLAIHGPTAVRDALQNHSSLAETLLTERLGNLSGVSAARQATLVLAASDPALWDAGVEQVSQSTGIPVTTVRRDLAAAVRAWDLDPRAISGEQISELSIVRARVESDKASQSAPDENVPSRALGYPPPANSTRPFPTPLRGHRKITFRHGFSKAPSRHYSHQTMAIQILGISQETRTIAATQLIVTILQTIPMAIKPRVARKLRK